MVPAAVLADAGGFDESAVHVGRLGPAPPHRAPPPGRLRAGSAGALPRARREHARGRRPHRARGCCAPTAAPSRRTSPLGPLRHRAYGGLHAMLAGSFHAQGRYGAAAAHGLRAVAHDPSRLTRLLGFPSAARRSVLVSAALYVCYLGVDEPLVATQVLPYVRALSARGYDMHLLTFETARAGCGRPCGVSDALRAQGITWHALRYHRWPSLPATLYDIARGALSSLPHRAASRDPACCTPARTSALRSGAAARRPPAPALPVRRARPPARRVRRRRAPAPRRARSTAWARRWSACSSVGPRGSCS